MNHSKKILTIFTIALAIISFSSCKDNLLNDALGTKKAFKANYSLAKTGAELITLRSNLSANLVKTKVDLDRILADYNTPLNKLSDGTLEDFKKEIVFRDDVGVVGFNYRVLAEQLNENEFAEVLALFGLDAKKGFWGFSKDKEIIQKLSGDPNDNEDNGPEEPTDPRIGWKCEGPHQCVQSAYSICLDGC